MTGLAAAEARMREHGLPEPAIRAFAARYRRLVDGETGLLPDVELEPVRDVPELAALRRPVDPAVLRRAVVVKLNGGLGTSMGLRRAKSLIEVKDGLSFLDVTARQVLALRRRHGTRIPLVLMHSFATRGDSLAALARYDDLSGDLPADFLQHEQPRLRADDLRPLHWPRRPALEWCPPGHGDVYGALAASGMLGALLERGYRYAFVANADNLGAVLDAELLCGFAAAGLDVLMEVVLGTEADRKGGHIARSGGRLVLRETAQAPEASFRDFRRWRYYNANNLWLDLEALARQGAPELPLIVNRKTADPADPASPPVLQLETAMGAAIGAFERTGAVLVPRSRFVPVKTTNDLLVLRSDAYELADDARLRAAAPTPYVDLDPEFFGRLDDFEARFPAGPPSLVRCERLVVRGDVRFSPFAA